LDDEPRIARDELRDLLLGASERRQLGGKMLEQRDSATVLLLSVR
jgi:hypothetical protein